MNRPEPDVVLPFEDQAPLQPEYHDDFALWLRVQAELLLERKFELLDVDKLAEEVDSTGRNLHRELKSRLDVILIHLLKLKFQSDHRSRNWLGSLREQRKQVARLLADSPSLKRHVVEYAEQEYQGAVASAADETGMPASTFPPTNPFSDAQLLDPDYVP
ncbi:MAG: DUF29 domain-containing protein [Massilia sp.]